MQLSKQIEKEVLLVYDTWLHSYMNGDVKTYDSYFDDDFHFIGSTGNEEFLSRQATTKFFESTADQMAGKTAIRNETKTIERFGELVFITHLFDGWFHDGNDWAFYSRFRFTNALQKTEAGWRFIYQHYSTPDSKAQDGETIGYEQVSAENQQLREAVKRRTVELEEKNRELEIETALERIRAQVAGMEKSEDLLDIVVSMRKEFVRLGHEAHYFWHMRWHPDKYEKAMTSGDGTRIGMVMELPRRIHGEIKQLADWERSDQPTIIFTMDVEAALDYVHKMGAWGDFQRIDPNMPTDDDIRHIGGLTYVMARTSLGEIGYSLPGVVKNVPQADQDILVRFARAFDLAHKRFEDLKKNERQTLNLIEEKERLEKTLHDLQVTQKQLIQSEKMASLGELTAGIAHEIQNPLNFVNNFSEVSIELLDEMTEEIENRDLDEAQAIAHDLKLNLKKINHHGQRADAIVKGMLQHSRKSSGEKTPTDINKLADEYLRLAYHGLRAKDKSFNASLYTDFDPTLEPLMVIPQDIGRVLLNLITNAFYAVQEKKKTEGTDYQPAVTLSTRKATDHIKVTVKDNGKGIPQQVLNKIFQPFFTTKPTGQGTGLGLSLSYDIVKAHGGEIKLRSEENEGTEFTIVLPLNSE